ncbi:MAG: tetratricopeptide repeat protein [bacterium]
MKAFVFTDAALEEQAGRFVWLEIDTEKAKNAAFRKKYPVRALPTYLVVEPDREQVLLKWVGGATVPQLQRLLTDVRGDFDRARKGALAGSGAKPAAGAPGAKGVPGADDLLAQADLLYGEGKGPEAAEVYQKAIAAAPSDWPRYGRAVEALLVDWSMEENCSSALPFARDVYPRLAKTTSVAVIAGVGLDCAAALPDSDSTKAASFEFFERAASQAVADQSIPMADDDRSGLYISLLEAHKAARDSSGARAVATSWASFLEGAAAKAPTPDARAVFDPHRLSAYLELGQPEKAVPMLQQSEADLPDDYNPPYRLAVAYKAMQRWDDALAACDRAIAHGYGPRLLNILRTRADILVAKGDTAAARATLEDAVKKSEALPEGQRSQGTTDALRKKLEGLAPAPPPAATGP